MIHTKIIKTIAAYALAVFLLLCYGAFTPRAVAFAAVEETDGTDILSDLCADQNFSMSKYPISEKDYALKVVQLAESKQGELLLYIYNPSASVRRFTATSINMSLQERDDPAATWDIYPLELLSRYDVFGKYRVKGFELKTDEIRYYNIASVFRPWVKGIDDELDKSTYNYIDEVSFRVAQFWTVYQDGDTVHYDNITSDVIEITEKYLGHIHYTKDIMPSWATLGFASADDGWDCWYVAFDTDKPIEKLLEADLTYDLWGWAVTMGVPMPASYSYNRKATITYTDKKSVEAVGAFKSRHNYEFDRIQSVDDFKKEVTDTDALRSLVGKKWILRFAETTAGGYNVGNVITGQVPLAGVKYTVNKVSVLRLEFETDGEPYNLGVVDNKQSASVFQPPSNSKGGCAGFSDWWILWLVVGILALCILMPILSLIFPVVGTVLKAVWLVITAPFRGLAALLKKKPKTKHSTGANKKSAAKGGKTKKSRKK